MVSTTPPSHSTPSLELDSREHSSPVDDYLSTPDVTEWREIRILEYEKDRKLAGEAQNPVDLPALEFCKEEPVIYELIPDLPVWPHTTIAPEDAFPDYAEVRQFLQEQARPSSPISEYELVETQFPACEDVHTSPRPAMPTPLATPVRRIGTKSKRNEDDDDHERPTPKRHRPHRANGQDVTSDIDSDDDGSGCFRPPSRPFKRRPSTSSRSKPNRRPAAPKPAKCSRREEYPIGPCSCREEDCLHCAMTCFYTFVDGDLKGKVCQRIFPKNRYLDLKRHKAAHAIHEWKLLEDGDITPEVAHWHLVECEGKEHGLICPNGDCPTTFTRYDALKRHMERGTCQHGIFFNDDDDNNRQLKADIIKASDEKRQRLAKARKSA